MTEAEIIRRLLDAIFEIRSQVLNAHYKINRLGNKTVVEENIDKCIATVDICLTLIQDAGIDLTSYTK